MIRRMRISTFGVAFLSALALTCAALLTTAGGVRAEKAETQGKSESRARKLEGTWRVEVTLRDCQTGGALGNPFQSLVTFARGGTTTATTARFSPALLSPFHGAWRHTGGRTYSSVARAFLFNPAGAWAGTQTLTQAIEFGDDRDEYVSAAAIEVTAPDGSLLSTNCAAAVGRRLE